MVMSIDLYIIVGEIRCVKTERLGSRSDLYAETKLVLPHDLLQFFDIPGDAASPLKNGHIVKININGVNRQGNPRRPGRGDDPAPVRVLTETGRLEKIGIGDGIGNLFCIVARSGALNLDPDQFGSPFAVSYHGLRQF
jgi:hypothetical protein